MSADFLHHPAARAAGNILKLALFAVAGIFLYALAFQLLVVSGLITAEIDGEGYGRALTQQALIVWGSGIALGIAGLFVRENWRWPLLFAPLYAPALYVLMAGFLR